MAQMPNGGKERSGGGWDDPMVFLVVIGGTYIGIQAAWYFGHEYIATGYSYIRYAQVWALNALANIGVPGLGWLNSWVSDICAPSGGYGACERDFADMQWGEISGSSMWANGLLLAVLVGYCVRMVMRMNKTNPKILYSKIHDVESFVQENKDLYPHLKLFGELDLISEPLDHPVYGMSETSRQFAFNRALIAGWKKEPDGTLTPILNRAKSHSVFRAQLGGLWTQLADLSPGELILFAIVAPKVAATDPHMGDDDFKQAIADSEGLIKWCWDQFEVPIDGETLLPDGRPDWLVPDFNLSTARELAIKYVRSPPIVQAIQSHAYRRTILIKMMLEARRLGVLHPAEVRWLRFYDRELWYFVDSIGRQSPFPEGAAAHTHFQYEVKEGSAIVEPQLDKAINGLTTALTAFKYQEKDKELYEEKIRTTPDQTGL